MDFLTGALVALLASTVIPFITEQWSLWSTRRGQIIAARREALDRYEETKALVSMKNLAQHPAAGPRYEIGVANDPDRQAAVARLVAQFAMKDEPIYDLWRLDPPHPKARLVLSSWANGQNVRARRAARRLIEVRESKQRDLGQPERQGPDHPRGEAE